MLDYKMIGVRVNHAQAKTAEKLAKDQGKTVPEIVREFLDREADRRLGKDEKAPTAR